MPDRVLVIITEASPSGLTGPGREALGLGARVAALAGSEFDAAILLDGDAGQAAVEAAERGAAHIYTFSREASVAPVDAAAAAITSSGARYVAVNRGPLVLDLVPRLAARLGGGCVMGVTDIRQGDDGVHAIAAVFGGAARAVYRFKGAGPRILSAAPGAAEAPERVTGRTAEVVPLNLPRTKEKVRVVESIRAPEGPRLEDARIVVSGGRGLRDAANYALVRDLADALGGMPGASRAIVDDAWAEPAQQVGLTGKIVTPQVYVAAGISGASQHMAGCSNSKMLVAINTDPDAPIFRYAQLGVVGNCLEILPELIRLAKERVAKA